MSAVVGVAAAVVAMMLIAAVTPTHAFTSIDEYEQLDGQARLNCLTGSMTGVPRREVEKILRDTRPRCRQAERRLRQIIRRCQLKQPENADVCTLTRSGYLVNRMPPLDPRRSIR